MYEQIRGSVLTAPNCVVDVGANIGTFTLYQALVEGREFADIGSCTNGSVPQWSPAAALTACTLYTLFTLRLALNL